MPRVDPAYIEFDYRVACAPDGSPYVGYYEDGRQYYNILAIRRGGTATNQHRVVARTETLDKANALVRALVEYTKRKDPA